jgi:SAM-dependent methyltransferase
MKIIDFRYITKNDQFDDSYPHWSRKYEYPTLSGILDTLELPVNPKIHNSSWGFDIEHHQRFKTELEKEYGIFSVTNSDILYRGINNTCIHDITQEPNDNFKNSFDVVLNVSALEEIPGDHVKYLSNLLKQVKIGGYLVITFDIPGLDLEKVEEFVGQEISHINYHDRIIGSGAPWFDGLTVGLLVIRK